MKLCAVIIKIISILVNRVSCVQDYLINIINLIIFPRYRRPAPFWLGRWLRGAAFDGRLTFCKRGRVSSPSTWTLQTHVCGAHMVAPSRRATARPCDVSSSRVPTAEHGTAFGKSPEWSAVAAISRACPAWVCADNTPSSFLETNDDSHAFWLPILSVSGNSLLHRVCHSIHDIVY